MVMSQAIVNTNKATTPLASRKKYPAPQRPSIQELKQRYEVQLDEAAKMCKPKSPKLRSRSVVKQMTSMFNNKINQIIRKDVVETSEKVVREPETLNKPPVPMPRLRRTKEKVPLPTPRSNAKSKTPPQSIGFMAEDVFANLSVKDKVALYTQFMEDMSQKNPKFGKHAELIEATVQKEATRGEVVNEKQESVKLLLQNLEAKCGMAKRQVSFRTWQKPKIIKRMNRKKSQKSKEYEDISQDGLNLSEMKPRRFYSLPRSKQDIAKFFKGLPKLQALNQDSKIMTACQTPKVITNAGSQLLTPQKCLQNQQLENLFYSWLKEKHDNEVSQQSNNSEMEEEKQKSAIDRLLEEAIVKLETQREESLREESLKQETLKEATAASEQPLKPKPLDLIQSSNSIPKITPRKKKRAPAVPIQIPEVSSEFGSPLAPSLPKQQSVPSEPESEFGISNRTNTTSDEDKSQKPESLVQGIMEPPVRPMRKKKMRRSLSWKKDNCLVESKPISSTDSEPESQMLERNPLNKKNNNKTQAAACATACATALNDDPSFSELDKSLMRGINSPRKIKSAYTLTMFSPPISNEESITDLEVSLEKEKDEAKEKDAEPRSLTDSFDQGFETGSNETESPIKPQRKSSLKRQSSIDSSRTLPENPNGFSTPIKSKNQENSHHNSSQQQLFSPISVPLKNRRRSFYDSESRRGSLAMQVIREDQPLEHHDIKSPSNLTNTQAFFANAPTLDMTSDLSADQNKTSNFWIKSGDFNINLDIYKNDVERVKLLYEIFSQRSCDTKDLHFGIDEYKFAVHASQYEDDKVDFRLPKSEGSSQYWFSTGDMAIPFPGKFLTKDKIRRLFAFIKASVEETGILRFGVDDVEFSNVPEFWNQSPKYSLESQYSMLVGLQSGHSNGLEGRSKDAWPHSKPVPVSDLDHSDFECEDFDEQSSSSSTNRRLSFSPFSSKSFDLSPSPESFGMGYENEPLDHLFENPSKIKSQKDKQNLAATTLPDALNTFQNQRERLSLVKERIASYDNALNISCDSLDGLKGTPDYIPKLKSIISEISKIGCGNGFKDCSLADLERFIFFLSRYADVCLNSCSSHMDKILDALMDQRSQKNVD